MHAWSRGRLSKEERNIAETLGVAEELSEVFREEGEEQAFVSQPEEAELVTAETASTLLQPTGAQGHKDFSIPHGIIGFIRMRI